MLLLSKWSTMEAVATSFHWGRAHRVEVHPSRFPPVTLSWLHAIWLPGDPWFQAGSHRTSLAWRLVQYETSQAYATFVHVYISRHLYRQGTCPCRKGHTTYQHQRYGTRAPIISSAKKWNVRHYCLLWFLIAGGGAIRHRGTWSYMDWQLSFYLALRIHTTHASYVQTKSKS